MYHYITLSVAKAYIDGQLNIYQALEYLMPSSNSNPLNESVLDLIYSLDQMNPDHKDSLIESFKMNELPTTCWSPWKALYQKLLNSLAPIAKVFQARSRAICLENVNPNVPVNLYSI